jgi:hypothetical protein
VHVLLGQRYWKLVFCYKIKRALRQSIVDGGQESILLRHQEIGGELRHLSLLHGDVARQWWGQVLHLWPVKFVPVRGFPLGPAFAAMPPESRRRGGTRIAIPGMFRQVSRVIGRVCCRERALHGPALRAATVMWHVRSTRSVIGCCWRARNVRRCGRK